MDLPPAIDVSIVIPCLNQGRALAACISAAREALDDISRRHGFTGEILVADNGSTDESCRIAERAGARVLPVADKGYGICLRSGLVAAAGRFIVVGNADGRIDFRDAASVVDRLAAGAGLCVSAKPRIPYPDRIMALGIWALAGVKVSHPRCSLKGFTRACIDRLDLRSNGKDIASEILVKAGLRREIVAETPIRQPTTPVEPDGGWPDNRASFGYLMILSPSWVFLTPALIGGAGALTILGIAGSEELHGRLHSSFFGNYWVILASAVLALAHMSGILGSAADLYGVREGYRKPSALAVFLAQRVTLGTFVLFGMALFVAGLTILSMLARNWVHRSFGLAYSVYPAVIGTLLLSLGGQTILGGFLLAIIGGNKSHFLDVSANEAPISVAALSGHPSNVPAREARDHSFVVLAYKDSPFLDGCLRSLQTQSIAGHIVIATSTPSPFIDRIAREHGVEVLVNPRREGIAADWNFALAAVGSRWVTLAHQDDLYYPLFLQRTLELFDRSRVGSLCFTGYSEIDDDGQLKSSKISKVKHLIQLTALGSEEPIRGWRLRMMLAFGNTLPCSSVTYDRERLGHFRFSDKYASNLDWDTWWGLAERGDVFLHTHERLIGRRHNPLTETSRLIQDGRRRNEDVDMFRRIWPRPISDLIAHIYKSGY